jgi:EAL domain-containing protein (putative c-di-GMP-specific phosphodiesterase class I)
MADGLPPLRMAVNVSGKELVDTDLLDRFREALEVTGVAPQQLEVEVTESATVETSNALEILAELRQMGVRIAIDDFGVGYSMLSRLNDFPLDKLKVDSSFIRKITYGEDEAPIVSGIIAMGHSLQLQVLAEGVETSEQLTFLKRSGCDQGQGFLFSRPLEGDQIPRLLERSYSSSSSANSA